MDEIEYFSEELLKMANIEKNQLHSLEIIGGSSRIPLVKSTLKRFLGREISETCDGDESIAIGSTYKCAINSPMFRAREYKVIDTFPYSIEIAWGNIDEKGNFELEKRLVLFKSFSAIPSAKLLTFRKTDPFQVVFNYANPEELPPGTNTFISNCTINPPKTTTKNVTDNYINVKIALTFDGLIAIRSVFLHEEIAVDNKEKENKDLKENKKDLNDDDNKENKKVKKEKKTKINFVTNEGYVPLKFVEEAMLKEKEMSDFDKKYDRIEELKNELESFVLEARSDVENKWKHY
ncbi:adenyl-nucleotide exchange factor sse1, partial [Bonamia ostreae]